MTYQTHIEPDGLEPPSCNTGVQSATPHPKNHGNSLRFDWYQASFKAQVDDVEALFIRDFGGEFLEGKGLHSYENGSKHSELAVLLMWGGRNDGIFLQVSGEDSDDVADWVRSNFPDHRVSRADIALDFIKPRGLDELTAIIEPVVRKAGVEVCLMGDPDPTRGKGRTIYFGAASSDVRTRIYEKGLKEIGAGDETANPDWVRFETQFRPKKIRKELAAKWTREEFFQMSKWANETANLVVGLDGTFQPDPSHKQNSDDLALEHMLNQYGNLLRRQVERRGWQSLQERMYITLFTPKERAAFEKNPSGLQGRREKETVSRSHHKGP